MSNEELARQRVQMTVLAMIGLVLTGLGAAWIKPTPMSPDFSLEAFGSTLGALFILTLLVERFTEVVLELWQGPESRERLAEVAVARAQVRATESSLDSDPYVAKAKLETATSQLNRWKLNTRHRALRIALLTGLLVGASGIRLLSLLFTMPTEELAERLFSFLDILLTATLVAGGSDSFHQFVRSIEDFFRPPKEDK